MSSQPVTPHLEFLFQAIVELSAPLEVGQTPLGERRVIPIVGGHFTGERLRGTVLPGGADFQVVRADGAALLDARYTLQTDDGALIYVSNLGIRYAEPEVLARLRRREEVEPTEYYFRTTPQFETGAEEYAWLNNLVAVCSGMRGAGSVVLDFYAVR